MSFEKYQHLVRLGTSETEGILNGTAYAFYKLDGTNGSVWGTDGHIRCGSRNRELAIGSDNAGFMSSIVNDKRYLPLIDKYKHLRLYGEWLVPHSLKTYVESAWRRFYVFDVYDQEQGRYLSYDEYVPIVKELELDYVPCFAILKNASESQVFDLLPKTGDFLVEAGKGLGEGLVIKNYEYTNKYGRVVWAKIINSEFKQVHHETMGAPVVTGSLLMEHRIVDEFVTEAFILKEKAKIENEEGEWTMKLFPKLLGLVWYGLITEESYNFVKKFKNPKVDFGFLNKLTINKVKEVLKV